MDDALRQLVRDRAHHTCGYCQIAAKDAPFLAFHIDHIVARQHGGNDDPENLALACLRCNFYKGSNLTGIDPASNEITSLFHPRHEKWYMHFALQGVHIIGKTPVGRTTARLLNMNAPERVELRIELIGPDGAGT